MFESPEAYEKHERHHEEQLNELPRMIIDRVEDLDSVFRPRATKESSQPHNVQEIYRDLEELTHGYLTALQSLRSENVHLEYDVLKTESEFEDFLLKTKKLITQERLSSSDIKTWNDQQENFCAFVELLMEDTLKKDDEPSEERTFSEN